MNQVLQALLDPFREFRRHRLWRASHLRQALADVLGPARRHEDDYGTHLRLTLGWLKTAQEAAGVGVARGWSFADGWLPPCLASGAELAETWLVVAPLAVQPELTVLAGRLLDDVLARPTAEGAVSGMDGVALPLFDQGRILRGLLAGHTVLQRQDCLEAGRKLGRWLLARQQADGGLPAPDGMPRAHHVSAAWALAALGRVTGEAASSEAARRALAWTLARQTPCGWFDANAAVADGVPSTAEIARTLRGVLETAALLDDEAALAAAERGALALLKQRRGDGGLDGAFDDEWDGCDSAVCVSGVAQAAVLWLRLAQLGRGPRWRDAGGLAIAYVKRTQRLGVDEFPAVRGAVPGAAPLWGACERFGYPTEAAKHFVDALVMDRVNVTVPPDFTAAPPTGNRP